MQSEAEKLVKEVARMMCRDPDECVFGSGSSVINADGTMTGHDECSMRAWEQMVPFARAVTALIVERCATMVANLPCCELQRTNEDRPARLFEYGAGAQSLAIEKAIRSLSPTQPEAKEAHTDAWPNGCHSPNSCTRHMACMYTNCRHENRSIKAEIEAALKAKEARE